MVNPAPLYKYGQGVSGINMKRDFEYWERAYFDGWLGKLIAAVFLGIYLLIIVSIYFHG
jgi:hypothetical protein